jgi:hypothetical protein
MLLTGFFITSVDIDTSTEDGKKISAALSDRSAQNIAGYTWQQKQGFGVANTALSGGGAIDLTVDGIADFFFKILSGSVVIEELSGTISFEELRQKYL